MGSRTFTTVPECRSEQGVRLERVVGVRARARSVTLKITLNRAPPAAYADRRKEAGRAQSSSRQACPRHNHRLVHPRRPRPQRPTEPYFDRARNVWVAPWRKPDGKVGRPTGRTRAAAEASRARHIATATEAARFAPLAEGFHIGTTLGEASRWWLDNIARHRVRITTRTAYDKQLRLVRTHLGDVPVRQLRPEQVA